MILGDITIVEVASLVENEGTEQTQLSNSAQLHALSMLLHHVGCAGRCPEPILIFYHFQEWGEAASYSASFVRPDARGSHFDYMKRSSIRFSGFKNWEKQAVQNKGSQVLDLRCEMRKYGMRVLPRPHAGLPGSEADHIGTEWETAPWRNVDELP